MTAMPICAATVTGEPVIRCRSSVVPFGAPSPARSEVRLCTRRWNLTWLDEHSGQALLYGSCLVLGAGMGCQMLSLLLAVQHGVDRSRLGLATSLNQFARSMGAAIGVAAMGAIMSRSIAGVTVPVDEASLSQATSMALSPELQVQVALALHRVFLAGAVVSAVALAATFFLPQIDLQPVRAMAGEQLLEAEMANLDAKSEPIVVE